MISIRQKVTDSIESKQEIICLSHHRNSRALEPPMWIKSQDHKNVRTLTRSMSGGRVFLIEDPITRKEISSDVSSAVPCSTWVVPSVNNLNPRSNGVWENANEYLWEQKFAQMKAVRYKYPGQVKRFNGKKRKTETWKDTTIVLLTSFPKMKNEIHVWSGNTRNMVLLLWRGLKMAPS